MLEWTGERCLPWVEDATLQYEHLHRYRLALDFVPDRRVLDLASGEGYGAALLAEKAAFVLGVDIDQPTIRHAARTYPRPNLRFTAANVIALPLGSGRGFDVVVCFEALEHVSEQEALLSEVKRILEPDGLFLVSTPNKDVYTDEAHYHNPFHHRELYLPEFRALLSRHFRQVAVLGQRVLPASNLFPLDGGTAAAPAYFLGRDDDGFRFLDAPVRKPKYFLGLASDRALPEARDCFLLDESDALLREHQAHARRMQEELTKKDAQILHATAYARGLERDLAAVRGSLLWRGIRWLRRRAGRDQG